MLPTASEIMHVYKKLERREETSKEIAELHLGEDDDAQISNQPVVRIRRGVYQFGKHFIVKVGGTRTSLIQEGRNMLFVRQATRIPVAAVYAFFRDEESDLEILVEEYIPGEDLVAAWGRLDQQGKDAMLITLRGYFDDLRQIPSPGYFGSPWRQPIIEPHICGGFGSAAIRNNPGPCETEEQWIELLIDRASQEHPLSANRTEFERALLHSVLQGHRHRPSVFTHGNFGLASARVRDDGVMFILDWQISGWYPAYWEFFTCIMRSLTKRWNPKDDWGLSVARIFDPYYAEYLGMRHWLAWLIYEGQD